jgi:arsenate-mycothiol transferase
MKKVAFVCVRNGGKSQMAAGLLRKHGLPGVEVDSAGTDPGTRLNAESVEALREVGVDLTGQVPQPLTPELVSEADLIVVLGAEARVESDGRTPVRTWETDEPSLRGIEGMERMRLIRDDIATRVAALAAELES